MSVESVRNPGRRGIPLQRVLSIALVLIVLLPSLPLGLSLWLNYRHDVGRLTEQVMEANEQIASLAARLCEDILSDVAMRLMLAPDLDAVDWTPAVTMLETTNAQGVVLASHSSDTRAGVSLAGFEWRSFAKEGVARFSFAVKPTHDQTSPSPVVLRIPHPNPQGFSGYRVAWLNIEHMRNLLAPRLDSPINRHLFLVDHTGNLIFHSDPLGNISPDSFRDDFSVRYFLEGGSGAVPAQGAEKNPGLAYVLPLASTGWGMIARADIAERMMGLKGRMIWLAAAILLSGLLAMAVVAVFTRMVILPLVELSRDIRRRSRAPTDPIQLSGPGQRIAEFRQLVAEFNAHSQERHRAEEQTVQAEKLATLGEMAAGLAHEIGTPLNVMRGNAQIIQRRLESDDPNLAVLDKIVQQTTRIADLIRGLLDLARADKEEFLLVEPVRIITRALETIRSLYPSIRTSMSVAEDCPKIRIRERAIEHAMLNLMVNACQAMDESGDLSVVLHFSPVSEELVIRVQDTGCGITPENLPKIFQPFFSTKPSGKGTGLGLALVDRVMHEHDGTVRVHSTPGEGSIFELYFKTRD